MASFLIVVGKGAFAQSFLDSSDIKTISFEKVDSNDLKQGALLHCGSGRQFEEALDFCKKHRMPMIQASNIQQARVDVDISFIEAPNLSIPILKFIHQLKKMAPHFTHAQKSLKESHQSTKKSLPETAFILADILHIKKDQIISVRDPIVQKEAFHVPDAFLNSHAIHEVELIEDDVALVLKTQVFGKRTYILGAKKLMSIIDTLPHRYIHISELIEEGLL
jgi:hypothetical protein